ncbi:MAG: chemotaxis-specific protein-glutamate methyltransferase CheB [Myxococcota bacterium]
MVVDDSSAIRRLVSTALATDPGIQVIGTASNGRAALDQLDALNPDLVTLDIEMPELDGLATLTELRRRRPRLPVIMVSSLTRKGAIETLEALGRGASDYVAKPDGPEAARRFAEVLCPRVRALCGPRLAPTATPRPPARLAPLAGIDRVRLLVIGASTGGPDAIAQVLRGLGPSPVPVAIVQHMPPVFTAMFAERLSANLRTRVTEATDGAPLPPGAIVVAPGDHHLAVEARDGGFVARVTRGPHVNSCRPAVDVLFASAAEVARGGAVGVILTGLGRDGCAGAQRLVDLGGTMIAQDEASSVVWGMPGAVVRAGLAHRIVPLSEVASTVLARFASTAAPAPLRRVR